MSDSNNDWLTYYTSPGITTDPGDYGYVLDDLPAGASGLCRIIQGVMIHIFWAERMGETLSEERKGEVQMRPTSAMLQAIHAKNDSSLTVQRPMSERLVGNCRDFSTLLCAMLRHQGIPARARCGFGTYFWPGHYEDHWMVEYWSAAEKRWIQVDPQLDVFQQEKLNITFDPLDMPEGQFVTGGKAWQMCRAGEADPVNFGIFDMHGMAFIRGDLIRDFLALNKVEILPWDDWGLIANSDEQAVSDETDLIDRIARLTLGGNESFADLRQLYESDSRLRMPADWQP